MSPSAYEAGRSRRTPCTPAMHWRSGWIFRLGEFVAEVRIEDGVPITVTVTFSPGHFSLEGDAQEMLNRVVSVESAFPTE